MRIRALLFALVGMGLVKVAFGAWVAVTSPIADQVPTVGIQSAESNVWEMNIVVPGLSVESFPADGETYDRVTLPDERTASTDGEAELPVISRMVALRTTGDPVLEVVSEEWEDLQGTYHLRLDQEGSRGKELAAAYLSRDEYLPAESFGVTPRQVMGGVPLAVVYIRAAKYNPAQQRLQVLKSAQIRVHETGETVSYTRPITETTAGILRAIVPNWDEVGANVNVVRGTLLYIMANNTTVPPEIQGMVNWRTRKGYTVETAGPTEIGSMTTANIKNYIQARYNAANPPLEFVCLLGDADGSYYIPAYSYTSGSYTGVGDYGYTQLDGTDLLPDVAIGRYCFDTTDELRVILNKTYYYEREPVAPTGGSNPNWYKGAALLAGDYNDGYSNSGYSTVQLMRWIRERLLENNYTSSSIDTVYYIHESVTATDVNSAINSGISVFAYRGMQYMTDYDSGDLSGLTNGRRLPFMAVITCNTNDFNTDSGQSSICEFLLKTGTMTTPKGAIGVVGTSSPGTHVLYNNCICGGLFQGLLREGLRTQGGSLERSKLELHINYPVDSVMVRFFCGISSLIGDPAVDIFTDTPDTLFVNNPSSIPVGTNTLTLTVTNELSQPVADAYVNLVKGTEVRMGDWTKSNGQVTFNFATTTAESLFVTASKHNYRPAINYTLVTTNTRFVSPPTPTFTVDDDDSGNSQGNGDGLVNPGEIIELPISLKNWGTSSASGVGATLSITSPFVTSIGNNSEAYGTIAAGSTVAPPGDFYFTLASYAHNGQVLPFTLTVTDNLSSTWISSVPIVVSNSDFEFFNYSLLDVTHYLGPGESSRLQVRLSNVGTQGTMTNTIAYLRSENAVLIVTDSIGTFSGSVAGGQTDNVRDSYNLTASNYALPGQSVPMKLIFPLANGFADTVSFIMPIGTVLSTTPTPPDSYGYWAFDNTDLDYAKHPTYNWFEIDNRYGGSGTNLNITDNADNNTQETTVVVNLPFTFKYYGQDFTQIAVCSNGWLAMGADQAVHTDFRNWHIPSALGPEAMIAPFWDDLHVTNTTSGGRIYTYNDAANHRFIVEWSRVYKYNGSSNPTETFECVLYQPGYPQTPTGDGEILFQYMTCTNTYDVSTDNDYATVGIENLIQSDGVLYSYWNIAGPGAATMTSGRAILFTTQRVPPVTPKAPTNLTVARSSNDLQLRWNGVHEDILDQPIAVSEYRLYRDVSPDFAPGESNYIASTSDTTYLDVNAIAGTKYFYIVQASSSGAVLSPTAGGDATIESH